MAGRDLRIAVLSDRMPTEHQSLKCAKELMLAALQEVSAEVTEFAPLPTRGRLSRATTLDLSERLKNGAYDVVLSAFSLLPLHQLDLPTHLVKAALPYAVRGLSSRPLIGGKTEFDVFNRPMARWLAHRDATALRHLDLILWPTDGLQTAAGSCFKLDPVRSHLVPWGGLCDSLGQSRPRLISYVAPVHLLMVGRDWFTSGGPIAFETLQILRSLGVDARLTIIGCIPPDNHVNEWVTVHPLLDLSIADQRAAYCAAFERAHFLIRPAVTAAGFAVCDASACGLPTLCFQIGQTPVQENVNGHVLPTGSRPDQFANWVRSYLDSPGAYVALGRRCQDESKERLTWESWGAKSAQILRAAAQLKRNPDG